MSDLQEWANATNWQVNCLSWRPQVSTCQN